MALLRCEGTFDGYEDYGDWDHEEVRFCRYCDAPIGHLHHNATHCRDTSCLEMYQAERRERVRKTSANWNHKIKPKKKGRKCRYCGDVLPAGRWFYCNEICQMRYLGSDRADGEWVFE